MKQRMTPYKGNPYDTAPGRSYFAERCEMCLLENENLRSERQHEARSRWSLSILPDNRLATITARQNFYWI